MVSHSAEVCFYVEQGVVVYCLSNDEFGSKAKKVFLFVCEGVREVCDLGVRCLWSVGTEAGVILSGSVCGFVFM